MNKRQKKKLIPRDTDYCYEITDRKDGILYIKRCPHYKVIGFIEDTMYDAIGNEHLCKSPVVYCSFSKVSSEEDILLLDNVKTCGERLPQNIHY